MIQCPDCRLEFDDSCISNGRIPRHHWHPTAHNREVCPGSGSIPRNCTTCGGKGRVTVWRADEYQYSPYTDPCGECGGSGLRRID